MVFEPPEAWPAVLSAGGRALFVQPSLREGVVHVFADRTQPAEVPSLLAHEFVHAADALLHGWDLSRVAALACSEVRAAGLADCTNSSGWPGERSRCARRGAARSAELAFPGGVGAVAVDTVFAACHETPLILGDAAAQRVALRSRGGDEVASAVLKV